jgi:hypothetical protein
MATDVHFITEHIGQPKRALVIIKEDVCLYKDISNWKVSSRCFHVHLNENKRETGQESSHVIQLPSPPPTKTIEGTQLFVLFHIKYRNYYYTNGTRSFIYKPLSSFVVVVVFRFTVCGDVCAVEVTSSGDMASTPGVDPVGCVLIRRQQRQDMSSSCNGLGSLLSGSLMSTKSH